MQISTRTFVPGHSFHILQEEITRQRNIQAKSPKSSSESLHAKGSEKVLSLLSDISALEEAIVRLSLEATSCALSSKSIEEIRQLTTLGREGLDEDIGKSWSWLQETLQMCEVHLQNASNYYQFQLCLEEIKQLLDIEKHREFLSTIIPPVNSNPFYLVQSSDLQEHLNYLTSLRRRVDRAVQLSHQVVPIKLRIESIKEPCAGVWLGSHFCWLDKGLQLSLNEPIIILDNSNKLLWHVRVHKTSQVVDLPSIGCMIPGPDFDAISQANKLLEQLGELWHQCATEIWKNIHQMLYLTMAEICDHEVAVNGTNRKRLLNLLQEFHNKYARKMLFQGDPWFDLFNACFQTLSNDGNVDRDEPLKDLNEGDITEIEQVMKCFKNLIKNYSVLKKKMKHHVKEIRIENDGYSSQRETDVPKLTRFPSLSSTDSELMSSYGRNSFQMSLHEEQIVSSWTHHFYDYRLTSVAPTTLRVSRFHCYIPDYGRDLFISSLYHNTRELQLSIPEVLPGNYTVSKEIQLSQRPEQMSGECFNYVNKIEISPIVEEVIKKEGKNLKTSRQSRNVASQTISEPTEEKPVVQSVAAQTEEKVKKPKKSSDVQTDSLKYVKTAAGHLRPQVSTTSQTDPPVPPAPPKQLFSTNSQTDPVKQRNQEIQIIVPATTVRSESNYVKSYSSGVCQVGDVKPTITEITTQTDVDRQWQEFVLHSQTKSSSVSIQTDPISYIRAVSSYIQPRNDFGTLITEPRPTCVSEGTQSEKFIGTSRGTQENLRHPTRSLGVVTERRMLKDNFTNMSGFASPKNQKIQTDPIPPPPPIECEEFTCQVDSELEIISVMRMKSFDTPSFNIIDKTVKLMD